MCQTGLRQTLPWLVPAGNRPFRNIDWTLHQDIPSHQEPEIKNRDCDEYKKSFGWEAETNQQSHNLCWDCTHFPGLSHSQGSISHNFLNKNWIWINQIIKNYDMILGQKVTTSSKEIVENLLSRFIFDGYMLFNSGWFFKCLIKDTKTMPYPPEMKYFEPVQESLALPLSHWASKYS